MARSEKDSRERTPKRARPTSPAASLEETPEKSAGVWQAGGGLDAAGLHPRQWTTEQLCDFLRCSGFAGSEELELLLTRLRGREEGKAARRAVACLTSQPSLTPDSGRVGSRWWFTGMRQRRQAEIGLTFLCG